ncbi:MAG TPA: valine--tRNA ligase [Candidatus Nanoarchaeia archaeon]|nr:valine--tRNA ligase [Candidatus Nanoarchaeia archaeon]
MAESGKKFPEPSIKESKWSKELEKDVYEKWKAEEPYRFDTGSNKKVYSIDTPPPYLNTPIHIGHATTYSLMDMFARYKRMKGFNVLFPLGLDNNGLPIEMAAEKKFDIRFHQLPREEFLKKCKQVLEDAGTASVDSFLRLGIGFNSWKRGTAIGEVYETDSEDYRKLTQETFIDLWNKGLIYEDERLNNYCPGCKTTLADAEVDRKETPASLNFVRFKVKETGKDAIIATTRPELLCTAALVIYNPSDERYRHLSGKTAVVPVFGREIKIVEDEEADPEFGSGLVFMSASAGDQDAIRFLRKRNIKPEQAVGADGLMLEVAGPLKGLRTKKAREKAISMLTEGGFMEKQIQFTHNVPICDRSGDEIEFLAMKEFYVKQVEFKRELLKIAGTLNFYAESSRQMLIDWINSISIDWPISRRRYYATEIPLWYCKKCHETVVPPKGRYYQPWKEPAPVKSCGKCGSQEFEGEERVLDTWFDSSNSPLYILKYNRDDNFFSKNFPCTLRPQGKDIVRTWLYYTLLKGYLLTGKAVFADAWINYYIVDDHGKKMSKRKGNVVDPHDILEKYGAEPFRLWAAVEGNITTTDFRCSFDRIDGAGKSIVKLWNVARFVSIFKAPSEGSRQKLLPLDNWIRREVNDVVTEAAKGYEQYDFHNPAQKVKHFLWETFASHYVELAKNRAYNSDGKFSKAEQDAAVATLHYCFERLLLVLAPVVPMVTYKLYSELYGKDAHFEKFPAAESYELTGFTGPELEELNSAIWKLKKDKGASLKSEIGKAVIPEKFKTIEADLKAAHNIVNVSYGKELKVDF